MRKLIILLFFILPLHAQFIRQYTSSSNPSGGCANNTAWVANTNHTFSWCDNGTWRTTAPISGTSFTSGSILYANSSGQIAQDNANLFYDATNKRVGIGIAVPLDILHISPLASGKYLRIDLFAGGAVNGIQFANTGSPI